MKKYFIPILILLIILFLFFVLQSRLKNTQKEENIKKGQQLQTNSQVAKNNLYINDKYGYKVEYPSSLDFEEFYEKRAVSFLISPVSFVEFMATIKQYNNYNPDSFSSISSWWGAYGPQNSRQAPYPDEEKEIIVDGKPAYYTAYESERYSFGFEKAVPVYIYVAYNGNIFEIAGTKLPNDTTGLTESEISQMKEYQKIFEEMLNSFTFID